MNVDRIADIDGGRHPCLGKGQCHGLGFAQFGPGTFRRQAIGFHEIGKLYEKKRKIALIPLFSPVLDHVGEDAAVLESPSGIALSLVPDCTLDPVRNQRTDHSIVK